jgi:hypothetical protein
VDVSCRSCRRAGYVALALPASAGWRRARPIGGIRDVNAFDGVLVGERVGATSSTTAEPWSGASRRLTSWCCSSARGWSRPLSPFLDLRRARSVTWVELRLEAEVSYAEIVEGRLRAPSWRAPSPRESR